MEHTQKYKDAFEKIKKIAPSDSNLDKIVADFIKVESLRGEAKLARIVVIFSVSFGFSGGGPELCTFQLCDGDEQPGRRAARADCQAEERHQTGQRAGRRKGETAKATGIVLQSACAHF